MDSREVRRRCRALEELALLEIEKEVAKDRLKIARRWAEFQDAYPGASAFAFAAEIIRTGRIPKLPRAA